MTVSLFEAERIESDGWRTIIVPAGTRVSVGRGWVALVSEASIACNCGKGVSCSLNSMERMEIG